MEKRAESREQRETVMATRVLVLLTCEVRIIACKPTERMYVIARACTDNGLSLGTSDGPRSGHQRDLACRGRNVAER